MIHEAMVLEYSGRHLAMIEWAASLKLFVYSCIGLALFLPFGVAAGGDWLGHRARAAGAAAKLAVGGAALAADRDDQRQDAHLPRARIPRHRVPARRAGDAGARAAGALRDAAALRPPAHQPARRGAAAARRSPCSRSGASFRSSTCSPRRALVLLPATVLVAALTGQTHLYWSALVTLAPQGDPAALDPAPPDPPAERQVGRGDPVQHPDHHADRHRAGDPRLQPGRADLAARRHGDPRRRSASRSPACCCRS